MTLGRSSPPVKRLYIPKPRQDVEISPEPPSRRMTSGLLKPSKADRRSFRRASRSHIIRICMSDPKSNQKTTWLIVEKLGDPEFGVLRQMADRQSRI